MYAFFWGGHLPNYSINRGELTKWNYQIDHFDYILSDSRSHLISTLIYLLGFHTRRMIYIFYKQYTCIEHIDNNDGIKFSINTHYSHVYTKETSNKTKPFNY